MSRTLSAHNGTLDPTSPSPPQAFLHFSPWSTDGLPPSHELKAQFLCLLHYLSSEIKLSFNRGLILWFNFQGQLFPGSVRVIVASVSFSGIDSVTEMGLNVFCSTLPSRYQDQSHPGIKSLEDFLKDLEHTCHPTIQEAEAGG